MNRKIRNLLLLFFICYLISGLIFQGNYYFNISIDNYAKIKINNSTEVSFALFVGKNDEYIYGYKTEKSFLPNYNNKRYFFIYNLKTKKYNNVNYKEFNEVIKSYKMYPYPVFKLLYTKDKLKDISYIFHPISYIKSLESSYIYKDFENPSWYKVFNINLNNILLFIILNPLMWMYICLLVFDKNKKNDKREYLEEQIGFYSFISLAYIFSIPIMLFKIYYQKNKWNIESLNKLNILNLLYMIIFNINIYIINLLHLFIDSFNIYISIFIYIFIIHLLIIIYYYLLKKIYCREYKLYFLIELILFIFIGVI